VVERRGPGDRGVPRSGTFPVNAQPQRRVPDRAAAERFLLLLDESAEQWTFQTFDDNKARKDGTLARVINGSLEDCYWELVSLNEIGAGVFVTVNQTDGRGRKVENIRRIRAVWHEDDAGRSMRFPLTPDITVASSPGKFHRYWLVDGLTTCQFRQVMETMIHTYGSDPNAKDLARVLRLPGFYHKKDPSRPFLVRIVDG